MNQMKINLRHRTSSLNPLPEEAGRTGGRGLSACTLNAEIDPQCEALSPENKLVFAHGLLGNLGLSGADRLSVGSKSPLTGGIKESNAGGTFALYLGRLGLRELVLEDSSPEWTLVVIESQGIRFEPAGDLIGLGTFETVRRLRSIYPALTSAAVIGPAGEKGFLAAGIAVTDIDGEPNRFAARGGLGAVMGSKKIKAIILGRGDQRPKPIDAERFAHLRNQYHQALLKNPTTGEWFAKYGTTGMVSSVNTLGGMPVNNFSRSKSELADRISGEALREIISSRGGDGKTGHPCVPGCVVRCSNIFPDRDGKAIVAPVEYETVAMLGSNLGIFDLDAIAEMNRICNDQGLDTIEVGGALGVAMEAGLGRFGSSEEAKGMLLEIVAGSLPGKVLGNGAAVAGKVLGCNRVPAVKGQTISAYDPRAIKGTGVTFATTPMGGDHTTGLTIFFPMDHHGTEGQLEASRASQLNRAAGDSLGICSFHLSPVANLLPELVNAAHGIQCDANYLKELGLKTIQAEIEFNSRAGISPLTNRVPAYFRTEALPPLGLVFDLPDKSLENFWAV